MQSEKTVAASIFSRSTILGLEFPGAACSDACIYPYSGPGCNSTSTKLYVPVPRHYANILVNSSVMICKLLLDVTGNEAKLFLSANNSQNGDFSREEVHYAGGCIISACAHTGPSHKMPYRACICAKPL